MRFSTYWARSNELYNRSHDPVTEVFEYFLDDDDADRVLSGQWLPFGVLDIGHSPDRFAEMSNDGLLAFDLQRAEGYRCPVLWICDGEVHEVGERLQDLKITVLGQAAVWPRWQTA